MSPGEKWMLQLSVDSWDILLKVCVFTCCKTWILASFIPTDAVAFRSTHFGTSTGSVYLDDVDCRGIESSLIDCPHSTLISCSGYYAGNAGVRCQGTNAGIHTSEILNSYTATTCSIISLLHCIIMLHAPSHLFMSCLGTLQYQWVSLWRYCCKTCFCIKFNTEWKSLSWAFYTLHHKWKEKKRK